MLSPIDIQLFRMYISNQKANAGSVWSNQPAIVLHHDNNIAAAAFFRLSEGQSVKWHIMITIRFTKPRLRH